MTGTERILNGKFWYLLTKIAQLLELSLLWTLFSVPVLTVGASSAALFDLLGRLDTMGSKTFSTFWESFKAHWKPGSLWWLFTAAVAALGIVDLSICIPNFTTGYFMAVVTGLLVALLLIFTCMSAYLLPLSITGGRTFRESLRPAMVFALSNIVGNVLIVLTLAAGTWILGRIWYVGFLFPAFFALPISTVTRRAMGKAGLLPEEDDE